MEPGAGRITVPDPFPGMAFEPVTPHRDLYVAGNPVDYVDPTGENFTELPSTLAVQYSRSPLYNSAALSRPTASTAARRLISRDLHSASDLRCDQWSLPCRRFQDAAAARRRPIHRTSPSPSDEAGRCSPPAGRSAGRAIADWVLRNTIIDARRGRYINLSQLRLYVQEVHSKLSLNRILYITLRVPRAPYRSGGT